VAGERGPVVEDEAGGGMPNMHNEGRNCKHRHQSPEQSVLNGFGNLQERFGAGPGVTFEVDDEWVWGKGSLMINGGGR
jgi:hypothetical protein